MSDTAPSANGRVQGFGCLLAVSNEMVLTHVSENCRDLLALDDMPAPGDPLSSVFPKDIVTELKKIAQERSDTTRTKRLFLYAPFKDGRLFDMSIHWSGPSLVIEFEPRPPVLATREEVSAVQFLIARVTDQRGHPAQAQAAVDGLRQLTGYDRVMLSKFETDGGHVVLADAHADDMDSLQGLRFGPDAFDDATKAQFRENPLRMVRDATEPTHAILQDGRANVRTLDLTLSVTQTGSEAELKTLQDFGARASMTIAVIRLGAVWGVFTCQHRTNRKISYERRSTAELFVQLYAHEIAQHEDATAKATMDAALSLRGSILHKLRDGAEGLMDVGLSQAMLDPVIACDGIAVLVGSNYRGQGAAPAADLALGLAAFLRNQPENRIFVTDRLPPEYPDAAKLRDSIAGIMALPISQTTDNYLVLFRAPRAVGPNALIQSPRSSHPWTEADVQAAEAIRTTLLEVDLEISERALAKQRRSREHQEVVIAELNHRVFNILNLLRALISQGRNETSDLEEFSEVLYQRVQALARAHDQMNRKNRTWMGLRNLIEIETEAFLAPKQGRVVFDGVEIDLSSTAFSSMALVVHELVTNSAKYGALRHPDGTVLVGVTLEPSGAATIRWKEQAGPKVSQPKRRGFGSKIITGSIPYELNGSAELNFIEDGVEAIFVLPARHITLAGPVPFAGKQAGLPAPSMVQTQGATLVVEDNMLIALDAADMMRKLGAQDVLTAATVAQAMEHIGAQDIALALIDVNLGSETAENLVEVCLTKNIPLILATGYGKDDQAMKRFPKAPYLRKPYTSDDIQDILRDL